MSTANKLLQAASGNAAGEDVTVEDVFANHLYDGNNGSQIISNGIALGSTNAGGSADFASGEYLERSSDFTSNSDGKTFTLSAWVFWEGSGVDILRFGNSRLILFQNWFECVLYNSSNSKIIDQNISLTSLSPSMSSREGSWVHVLLSLDVNSGSGKLYISDTAVSWSVSISNNSDIDFTRSTHYMHGNSNTGPSKLSSVYLDYTYRNLATESNRRLFINSDGYAVSGLESNNPIIYMPFSPDYAITKNLGTGGDFSIGSGSPSITNDFGPFKDTSLAKGGLVWLKARSENQNFGLFDTERGATKSIYSSAQDGEGTISGVTQFNSNGFEMGSTFNSSNQEYISWTFRKQEKFFDIVTYTGNGTAGRAISHNLGSVPGLILIKRTDSTARWSVYHRSLGSSAHLVLNTTAMQTTSSSDFNSTDPTATEFTVGSNSSVNSSSSTYVAYLFAHTPNSNFDEEVFSTEYFADGSSPVSVTGPDGTGEYNFFTNTSLGNTYARIAGVSRSVSGVNNWDGLSDYLYTIYGKRYRRGEYKYTNGGIAPHYGVRYYTNYTGTTVDDGEDLIVCGAYAGTGTEDREVVVGFEPQWVLIKRYSASDNWRVYDSSRPKEELYPENVTSAYEFSAGLEFTSNGFRLPMSYSPNSVEEDYVYVAIRKNMKSPESGTEVFAMNNYVGDSASNRILTSGFQTDLNIFKGEYTGNAPAWFDRLRGNGKKLESSSQGAESDRDICDFDRSDGIVMPNAYGENNYNHPSYTNNYGYINYQLKRAESFFDIVSYHGTGTNDTKEHNLGVTPEFMIVKRRNSSTEWQCYHSALGATKTIELQSTAASYTGSFWNDTAPTSSVFSVNSFGNVNGSGNDYIAYLFATLDGVSKVGSYTGTGSNVDVDCGFSAGARFVMVKRTDSTGDWYFWDTDRGIVAGNDSYMIFNDTDGENTSNDYIDPLSSGFTITSSAPAALNASGGTYIFLAIA